MTSSNKGAKQHGVEQEEQHEVEVEVVAEAAHLARREEVHHEGEEGEWDRCEAVAARDHDLHPSNNEALRMARGPFEEHEAAVSALPQQRALTNDHRLR